MPLPQYTIKRLVTATVTPKECTNDIELSIAGENRIQITNVVKTPTTGIITFEVKGTTATPANKPDGDTTIQAKHGQAVAGSVNVIVVIPKTQVHDFVNNPVSFLNDATPNVPPGKTNMWSTGKRDVTIKLYDQFGALLNSIYDGTNVLYESWIPPKEFITLPALQDSYMPQQLATGVLTDPTAGTEGWVYEGVLTPQQLQQWRTGTLDLPGGFNTLVGYLASLPNPTAPGYGKATQVITVHGHSVTPNYQRIMQLKKDNWIPGVFVPYDQSDTAVGP